MSEKEIKKQIRKLKLKKWCRTRLFAEVGSLIGAGFLLISGLNIFELITLIIIIIIWNGMMFSLAYWKNDSSELKEIDENIEKLKKAKVVKEDGNEKIKKFEKNFSERLKKGEHKILLNEDGEIKSEKHEVEEKVEPKKESILPELVDVYVSYSYSGTGLSKEELTNLKNDLLEKLNVLMNENNPETVESQLTNKEEVKVKKYTCNDIKE